MVTASPSLWRQRNYLLWLSGDTAQEVGLGLGSFAMPLVTLAVTGSPSTTGTVAAIQAAGGIVGFLPGGVLADRFDRRRLRIWSASIGAALSALLTALAVAEALSAWSLATIGFLLQLRASMLTPASEAMLRDIVAKDQLGQASANNEGRDATVALISGPVGGACYAVSQALPFLAQTVSFMVLWATNRGIPGTFRPSDRRHVSPWKDLLEGLNFVTASRLISVTCCAFMLLNLSVNGAVLTTIYQLQLAGHRPQTLGLVTFALGVGALLGAVAAGVFLRRIATGLLIILAMAVFATGVGVLSLDSSLQVALPVLTSAMVAAPAVNAAVGGLLMHIVPNQLLGRVQSVVFLLSVLLAPLGPALAGWGMEAIGASATYAAFALLAMMGTCTALAYGPIRRLPRMECWNQVRL